MASSLSSRVHGLESALSLILEITERMRHLQPTTQGLIRYLSVSERFASLGFLEDCNRRMQSGLPFPESWRQAVRRREHVLGKEAVEVLAPLGEVLGSTGLESQLSALACARELLEDRLEGARRYSARHAKLYRAMGALCGAALVILFV